MFSSQSFGHHSRCLTLAVHSWCSVCSCRNSPKNRQRCQKSHTYVYVPLDSNDFSMYCDKNLQLNLKNSTHPRNSGTGYRKTGNNSRHGCNPSLLVMNREHKTEHSDPLHNDLRSWLINCLIQSQCQINQNKLHKWCEERMSRYSTLYIPSSLCLLSINKNSPEQTHQVLGVLLLLLSAPALVYRPFLCLLLLKKSIMPSAFPKSFHHPHGKIQ